MIVGSNILAGASGQAGYFLNRSVRLRASASAYFNRTFGTPTNNTVWSYSGWNKLGVLGTTRILLGGSGTNYGSFGFETTDQFRFWNNAGAAAATSTAVFRDPSAWYHVCVISNGTTIKAYINNAEILSYTGTITNINSAIAHNIGRFGSISYFYDGYLTEINFIDGQALTPTSFGEYNTLTGVWQPKKYGGTYGTNGFYLNFNDNSAATAAAIGKDSSGNGNNWTPNNISVTAGVTYDSMTDVPTLTNTTTSNYATLNPLNIGGNASSANLNHAGTSAAWYSSSSTIAFDASANSYAEVTIVSNNAVSNGIELGIMGSAQALSNNTTFMGFYPTGYCWQSYIGGGGFNKFNNNVGGVYNSGATYTTNDIIGISLNNGTLTFYKNGVSQGVAYSGLSGSFCFADAVYNGDTVAWNFGQRPFSYTPPTGASRINTYNLPTPTISNGATQFAATLYTGNGSTQNISNAVNGISFQPDFVWVKSRSLGTGHILEDAVRGALQYLGSESTAAESTIAGTITAFNSNGFSVGNQGGTNANAATQVGWQWKASNAAAVTNTSGTISSQVSANPSAGFSIVTWTGNGVSSATIGHGLGVQPAMVITKSRSLVNDWWVAHKGIPNSWLQLETTGAAGTSGGTNGTINYQSTFTSNVFGFLAGSSSVNNVNQNAATYVAYCFSEITGYSKFGSYTGNGSADGVFVYLGFRPRWVMVKSSTTSVDATWVIKDTSRNPSNVASANLYANQNNAEDTASSANIDILSNGFKLRGTYNGTNGSGQTYIYAAFCESPFKNSLAR